QGPGHSHWSYEDREHWGVDYPDCMGTMQSPININMAKTIFSPELQPIQLSGYSLPANEKLKLRNNGHTGVAGIRCLSQGVIPPCWPCHHWSPFGPCPCHYCGVSVLQVGPRENPYYQEILEHLYKIQREGEEVLVPGFNIAGLLPANLKLYFHYNGSLTTPPCYQTVKWTVFNQTMLLSHDQMSMLVTSLRNDDGEPLQNNYRLVQDLHRRRVLASFQTTLFSAKRLPSGDVLAVLFGVLFAVTALAFLLYIYKHRSQNARLDSPTKSKVIYTAATTENTG
ncbi:Carbonic anhydrase 9, partial [Pygoscelis adeliae]